MKKAVCLIGIIVIFVLSSSVSAESLKWSEVFDSEEVDFQTLHTTAYCLHGTTATGGTTHYGIAACDPHIGEIASVYTIDGEFLGYYEITDKGGTDAIREGKVIDVWFDSLDECSAWMKKTGGKVKVYFVKGR